MTAVKLAAPSTGVTPDDALVAVGELEHYETHRLLGWLCGRDPELIVDTIKAMRAFRLNAGGES